jgi:5'-nucleotidase
MPRILVTNDDGVRSDGILALARALEPIGDVTIVAPLTEASAIGHALTLRRPLRLENVGDRIYGVDGTPTDCVNIAVTKVLGGMPDLVVSGINKGYNLGDDVTYSGTVAGALEGALLGIPSLAVSLERSRDTFDFSQAAAAAAAVATAVLQNGLPTRTLLNVNVPRKKSRGFRITVQARRNHVTSVAEKLDPRQQPYFWIEEGQSAWESNERSDYAAVKAGYISITPLHPDLTHYDALSHVERLSFGQEVETT